VYIKIDVLHRTFLLFLYPHKIWAEIYSFLSFSYTFYKNINKALDDKFIEIQIN